ncbi:hypothetical protein PACTADRAFT_74358 [Pachysolen tannophilus NRRL Y-2460]|uniref:N-acetyltransferase domain-containing protein n=1 Tax=Pachysolen tannophilus NRRL Y-2460 TaxID=669874 RepID=A0A1E4TYD3_PACTA|nr:hypothetical protein PACTADRAFT_74358 [Pachysolen tannophilus NRRL Y-2460]
MDQSGFSKNSNIINNLNIRDVNLYENFNDINIGENKSKPNNSAANFNSISDNNNDNNCFIKQKLVPFIVENNVDENEAIDTLEVEIVDASNYRKAAKTLQIAFVDDKFAEYLTKPIQSQFLKEQVELAIFEASVYSSILDGLVVAIRDKEAEKIDPNAPFLACACFTKPDSTSGFWSMVRAGYLKVAWLANKECRRRVFQEQYPLLNETKSKVLGKDYDESWYLSDIGTTPNARGKGCARKLLEYVYKNFIDINNHLCYLESSHPRNKIIYEKLGFTYVMTIDVGHINCDCTDGPCDESPLQMDIMVRGIKGSKWIANSKNLNQQIIKD